MISVLLADDHAAVRGSIRRVLASDPRVKVVGEASDFSEAITQAQDIKPDIMIVDLHMPLKPNLSMCELKAQLKSCGAGILGMSFANDDLASALANSIGAAELLDKIELGKELIPAIMRVASTSHFSGIQAQPGARSAP